MNNIYKLFSTYKMELLLLLISAIFFVLYSFLAITVPHIYNSPDEKANYFFGSQIALEKDLGFEDSLNLFAPGLIHPRSTGVINSIILPGSFLGFIGIIGWLGRFLSVAAMPFITPFFAVLTPILFYFCIKPFFGKRIGYVSALLLYIFPAYWYWSTRSLMHNILFVDTLIAVWAIYGFLPTVKRNIVKVSIAILGGILLGVALSIRTNEIIWVLPIFLYSLYMMYKTKVLKPVYCISALISFGIIGLCILYGNYSVFGNPFFTGYFTLNNLISGEVQQGPVIISLFKSVFLPFGFDLKQIIKNVLKYALYIYWWWSLPAIIGLVLFYKKNTLKNIHKRYFAILGLSGFYLIIYYGSWNFSDHPDPFIISLGASYTRYWLPIYIGCLPFVAYCILELTNTMKRISNEFAQKLLVMVLLIYGGVSMSMLFVGTDESFLQMRVAMSREYQYSNYIVSQIPENSVVIVDSDDKFIFPDRSVIVPFRDPKVDVALVQLKDVVPIYYYGITLPEQDLVYLNERRLYDIGFYIEPLIHLENNKTLYLLSPEE